MTRPARTRRPNGSGTAAFPEYRPDGSIKRWRVAVTAGIDEKGKPVRRFLNAKDERSVIQKRSEWLRNRTADERPIARNSRLNELLDRWLAFKRELAVTGELSKLTVEGYEDYSNLYIRPGLGHLRLRDLTPEVVSRKLLALSTEEGMSSTTVSNVHAVLRACLNQGVRWRAITRSEADIGPCPIRRRNPAPRQILEVEQLRAFLTAIRGHRHEVMFTTALLTGLRTEELYGLTWDRIKEDHIQVRAALQYHDGKPVLVNELKTAKSRRDVPITKELHARFQSLREQRMRDLTRREPTQWDQSGLAFVSRNGLPMSHSNVNKQLKAILKRAGLPLLAPYDLRHCHATTSLTLGVDRHVVMDVMGHTTPAMTMHYEHVVKQLKFDAVEAMSNALSL